MTDQEWEEQEQKEKLMKGEEKQPKKDEEAEVKEEVPGGNPEDESSRTCYIDHPLREKKKSVDGLVKAGAPPKLFLCCLPRSVCLPRSEPALEGSLQSTLFLFPALADGCSLNGRPQCPDNRTCGLYRTREHESGRIVD